MRRDAELGDLVHVPGSDLDLEGVRLRAEHRGVKRLVRVGFRDRDVVLHPARHRGPLLVDQAEDPITIPHCLDNHPEGQEVEDIRHVHLLPPELLIDRIHVLDAPVDGPVDAVGEKQAFDDPPNLGEPPFGGVGAILDLVLETLPLFRVEIAEAKVLHLHLDASDPESIGDGRIDVEGLLGDGDLPVGPQKAQGSHVVQPVGQLDQDDAYIVHGGEKKPAEVLGFRGLARRERTLLISLSKTSMFVLWLALLSTAVLCQLRAYLERAGKMLAFVLGFGILVLLSLILAEGAWQIMSWLGQSGIINGSHGDFVLRTFAISSIVIALFMRYLYVASEWRRSIVLEAQARISALQALIRPHFLFNSMNTIASLTRSNPRQAEEAVEDLSDLLRATLSSPRDLSSLQQELEIAETYERIEKLRLGDRLTVRWDFGDVPMTALVPTLTLQPLLENAIYHGIELMPDGGEVSVSGRRDGNTLEIRMSNPVSDGQARHVDGNQMALSNIEQRFELAFGASGGFDIDASKERFIVTLRFPVEEERP